MTSSELLTFPLPEKIIDASGTPIDIDKLTLAGFANKSVRLPRPHQPSPTYTEAWPVPLLILEGESPHRSKARDQEIIELYTLLPDQSGTDDWRLYRGWDTAVVPNEYKLGGGPYLWASAGKTAVDLFREAIPYDQSALRKKISHSLSRTLPPSKLVDL